MAKRGDPAVLRMVVIFLRFHAGMTQTDFGKVTRLDQAKVSRYEKGEVAPSEEVLRRMAKAAGLEWPLVAQLGQFYSTLLSAAGRISTAPEEWDLGPKVHEAVQLAMAPYLLEAGRVEPPRLSAEEARREAKQIWTVLERHPLSFRRRLIELSPHAGSWHLVVTACEASVSKAGHEAVEALELAELALSIAERAPGDESWRSRLKGYCWAHVGNAHRVANDLAGADQAFAKAWNLWWAGTDSGLLAEWMLPSLEASLRREERRFQEALGLLDRAKTAQGGSSPAALTALLLKKEFVFEQMGDLQGALAVLAEATPLVEASEDTRKLFALRFKTANILYHLERFSEAAPLLPQVIELAEGQGNDLDLIRVDWLEARIMAGLGRTEEAAAGFEQVRRDFMSRGLAYDAALASLDHAVLWLKAGRMAEVRELAMAMGWIFEAKGIRREALASLKLFCEAARQESATVELVQRVIGEMEQAKHPASSRGERRGRG